MDEEKNEEVNEESSEENSEESSEDNREEETRDEIKDNDYANDDEIEMLRSIEERFSKLEEKMDNVLSMFVDFGAGMVDSVEDISEDEREAYEDDFINIDELDLAL